MKRVSVYVKGDRNSTAYYRIYQYIDNIAGVDSTYRMMMSPRVHNRYMPISKQPIWVKVLVYLHIYLRMLLALLRDTISSTDVVVIHRRVISRFMPWSYRALLRLIKCRGAKIVWDFDDNILESGEVSKSTFEFYSEISDVIIVTHDFLKDMVSSEFQSKVHIMPTTDGDMYQSFVQGDVNATRLASIDSKLKLVWVATSSNLCYLSGIMAELDAVAEQLSLRGTALTLQVVCNEPINYSCKHLQVENIKWTRDVAIDSMKRGHIGLMPLSDNAFTKGKGGFKLVQYMSIGLPCIGSNVGYNAYVLSDDAGLLVDERFGWQEAILKLSDRDVWAQYSINAYNKWQRDFSYVDNLKQWQTIVAE